MLQNRKLCADKDSLFRFAQGRSKIEPGFFLGQTFGITNMIASLIVTNKNEFMKKFLFYLFIGFNFPPPPRGLSINTKKIRCLFLMTSVIDLEQNAIISQKK